MASDIPTVIRGASSLMPQTAAEASSGFSPAQILMEKIFARGGLPAAMDILAEMEGSYNEPNTTPTCTSPKNASSSSHRIPVPSAQENQSPTTVCSPGKWNLVPGSPESVGLSVPSPQKRGQALSSPDRQAQVISSPGNRQMTHLSPNNRSPVNQNLPSQPQMANQPEEPYKSPSALYKHHANLSPPQRNPGAFGSPVGRFAENRSPGLQAVNSFPEGPNLAGNSRRRPVSPSFPMRPVSPAPNARPVSPSVFSRQLASPAPAGRPTSPSCYPRSRSPGAHRSSLSPVGPPRSLSPSARAFPMSPSFENDDDQNDFLASPAFRPFRYSETGRQAPRSLIPTTGETPQTQPPQISGQAPIVNTTTGRIASVGYQGARGTPTHPPSLSEESRLLTTGPQPSSFSSLCSDDNNSSEKVSSCASPVSFPTGPGIKDIESSDANNPAPALLDQELRDGNLGRLRSPDARFADSTGARQPQGIPEEAPTSGRRHSIGHPLRYAGEEGYRSPEPIEGALGGAARLRRPSFGPAFQSTNEEDEHPEPVEGAPGGGATGTQRPSCGPAYQPMSEEDEHEVAAGYIEGQEVGSPDERRLSDPAMNKSSSQAGALKGAQSQRRVLSQAPSKAKVSTRPVMKLGARRQSEPNNQAQAYAAPAKSNLGAMRRTQSSIAGTSGETPAKGPLFRRRQPLCEALSHVSPPTRIEKAPSGVRPTPPKDKALSQRHGNNTPTARPHLRSPTENIIW